jgi:hypothetical protein
MNLCDIWFSIRNKPGWLADCAEAGYTKAQLTAMEQMDEAYSGRDLDVADFYKPDESEPKPLSDFRRIRNEKFPQLDKEVKEWEKGRARDFPLFQLLGLFSGERIPCPFHKGKDKNFMVKDIGYCFVCHEHCDSIRWQMVFRNMNFPDAVRSLN